MTSPSRQKNRTIYFNCKVHRQQQGQQSVIINDIINYNIIIVKFTFKINFIRSKIRNWTKPLQT